MLLIFVPVSLKKKTRDVTTVDISVSLCMSPLRNNAEKVETLVAMLEQNTILFRARQIKFTLRFYYSNVKKIKYIVHSSSVQLMF